MSLFTIFSKNLHENTQDHENIHLQNCGVLLTNENCKHTSAATQLRMLINTATITNNAKQALLPLRGEQWKKGITKRKKGLRIGLQKSGKETIW